MITLIILTAATAAGWLLHAKTKRYCYGIYEYLDFMGLTVRFLGAGAILIHTALWLPKGYIYGKWVAEREAFTQTLAEAREKGSEFERAAIVREVAEWNARLAKAKYDNANWLLGQYVDDRVDSLEPIR